MSKKKKDTLMKNIVTMFENFSRLYIQEKQE